MDLKCEKHIFFWVIRSQLISSKYLEILLVYKYQYYYNFFNFHYFCIIMNTLVPLPLSFKLYELFLKEEEIIKTKYP